MVAAMTSEPNAQLAQAGFDLIHTFDATAAAREPGLALIAGELGILIGNTRALWPPFVAAMQDPALAAEANPLERYTERTIEEAFPGGRIYYAHRRYEGGFLPFQRLAVATGLGALAPSHLVIHPVFGPWFALRAIVIVAGSPPVRLPIAQPCRCDAGCAEALAKAQRSTDWRAWLAVRDACTLSAQRYGDDQVRYHYTKVW
jgi:methylmalonic aciduria homocystinuria type C protein